MGGFFQQRRDLEENILVGQRDRLQSGSLRSKPAVQVTKLNLQRISSIQKLRSRKHETCTPFCEQFPRPPDKVGSAQCLRVAAFKVPRLPHRDLAATIPRPLVPREAVQGLRLPVHQNQRQDGLDHRPGWRRLRPQLDFLAPNLPERADDVDRPAGGELPDRGERQHLRPLRVQGGGSEPWKPSTNLNNKNSASTNQNAKNALTTVTPTTTPANKNIESLDASVPSCKESLRNMDYLLDPRKSGSIEHLAAYVSS